VQEVAWEKVIVHTVNNTQCRGVGQAIVNNRAGRVKPIEATYLDKVSSQRASR
jgi:hypothetical protein